MAEAAERAFLGLTHNPFIRPDEGFFERGDRKTHLEQLRHLSQWSRRVLLVTGPHGVGKTSLYRQLTATLEPRVKAARINGALVTASREVLMAIAQGFGLAAPGNANSQLLKSLITGHVTDQAEAERQCLAVIDDAHLLEPRVIDELIELVHECALHVVLFGEVRLVPGVERSASRLGVGWHEIRLTGYGGEDARDYLEWRFQQARYRGRIPFTDQQIREIVKLSEGLPGKINQMANVLLVKLESGTDEEDEGGRFPRLHTALLILLLTMIGLVYLLLGDTEVELPVVATADEQVDADRVPDPVTPEMSSTVEQEPPASELALIDTPFQPRPSELNPDKPAPADDAAELPSVSEPVIESVVEQAETPPTSSDDAQQAVAEPAEEPNLQVLPEEVPQAESQSPRSTPETDSGSAERDGSWLLAQDPDTFTLQLVTVSSMERANAFVGKQRQPQDFAIYQLRRDGRTLHVVIYGLFNTRSAAQGAADDLPAEVGNVQPWVRSLAQVQGAARTSLLE